MDKLALSDTHVDFGDQMLMWSRDSRKLSDMAKSCVPVSAGQFCYKLLWFVLFSFTCLTLNGPIHRCWAQPKNGDDSLEYLKNLSIEELLQTEVTSVSKKTEQLFDATAAIFVITQEDIKRTGVRSIPEALRMVPGLQVAHINGSTYAITARGFNEWFSNKLLVLIDGRSVYTPLFSGVYWDVQDTVIEDVERIEVIRGPGATMWGSNAVNGVINIITKHSENTQGGLIVAGAGNIEKPLAVVRYGGKAGHDVTFRIYAKGFNRDSFKTEGGGYANDEWENKRVGFRMDWKIAPQDILTLQGETYDGADDFNLRLSGFITPPYTRESEEEQTYNGGHLITAWQRKLSQDSEIEAKIYYDRTYRDQVVIEERRETLDFDFKHNLKPHHRHEVVWGMGYRWTKDDTEASTNLWMDPDSRDDQLWNAFVQDEIMIFPEKIWLTLGSKFERNSYTGFEIQPNARIRWKPTSKHTLWGSVARAVRTPSRSDHDIRVNLNSMEVPMAGLAVLRITGDEDFESEELLAYEMGLRWQRDEKLSVDLAAFYNVYDDLRTVEAGQQFVETTPAPAHAVIPLVVTNGMQGETYGIEALTTWKPVRNWKLNFGYAWFDYHLDASGNSTEDEGGISPQHQFQIRSYLDLPWSLSLDTELYFVDELETFEIPSFTRLDLRFGWEPKKSWAISLNIENLLDDQHPEFPTRSGVVATEVPRVVYGQVTFRF